MRLPASVKYTNSNISPNIQGKYLYLNLWKNSIRIYRVQVWEIHFYITAVNIKNYNFVWYFHQVWLFITSLNDILRFFSIRIGVYGGNSSQLFYIVLRLCISIERNHSEMIYHSMKRI